MLNSSRHAWVLKMGMYQFNRHNDIRRCVIQCGSGKNVWKEYSRVQSSPAGPLSLHPFMGAGLAIRGANQKRMWSGHAGEINDKLTKTHCQVDASSRVIVEDDVHGIQNDDVLGNAAVWHIMTRLRHQGHECFLVGGTVRDFILGKNKPKDFDVLTSADPYQVSKMFKKAFVLGKSYPIVHVHYKKQVIEVSSFSTNCDPSRIPLDAAALSAIYTDKNSELYDDNKEDRRQGKQNRRGYKKLHGATSYLPHMPRGEVSESDRNNGIEKKPHATWAMARRENAMKRDFTVNGLLYDPFSRILFDYVNGLQDCKDLMLRTIADPKESFTKDPARMLRAIRLAARSSLAIEEEMGRWLHKLRGLILNLSQSRLQMELHAMMSHGAAAESFALLEKYRLLEIMLPHQFRYIRHHYCQGEEEEEVDHVFTSLLQVLDSFGSPACPLDSSMWIAILAAPIVEGEYAKYIGKTGEQKDNSDSDSETRLDVYYAIVDETMLRLLTNTDFMLSYSNNDEETKADASNSIISQKSPCLLPRQAVESAAHMLKLEAGTREHSDIPDISPKEYRKSIRSRKKRTISGKKKIQPAEHVVLHVLRHKSIPWKRVQL